MSVICLFCERLGGLLASSVVGYRFDPQPSQTNDIKTGICCFSAKHEAFRSKKKKDWLPQSQNNVSGLSGMSSCGLLLS